MNIITHQCDVNPHTAPICWSNL